jgi:hypothetical protein
VAEDSQSIPLRAGPLTASQTEIDGDNPCSQHLSGNTVISDYRVNQAHAAVLLMISANFRTKLATSKQENVQMKPNAAYLPEWNAPPRLLSEVKNEGT